MIRWELNVSIIGTDLESVKRNELRSGSDRQRSRVDELRAIPGHVTSRDLHASGLIPQGRRGEKARQTMEGSVRASELARSVNYCNQSRWTANLRRSAASDFLGVPYTKKPSGKNTCSLGVVGLYSVLVLCTPSVGSKGRYGSCVGGR